MLKLINFKNITFQELIFNLDNDETVCMSCSPATLDSSARLQEKNDLMIDWI